MKRKIETTPSPRRKGLVLTSRDQTCIREVHDLRFVTTDDLMTLTGSQGRRSFNYRTQKLRENEYLDQPEFFVRHFAYDDRRPTVHALGNAGAAWLAEHDGMRFPDRVGWRSRNKDIKGAEQALHTLGVSRTIVRLVADVREAAGVQLSRQQAVWQCSPSYQPSVKDPFGLPTELNWIDGEVYPRKTRPDYTVVLGDERSGRLRRGLLFLEYDRATEDYTRSSPWRSSHLQKLLGYADALERGIHSDRFGFRRFRVLYVTEGDEAHIRNIRNVFQHHVADVLPASAVLFTTTATLFEHGFLAPIWMDAAGKTTSLLGDGGATQNTRPDLRPAVSA